MPTTQIACLGLSHNTAPVALRERLSCVLPERDRPLHSSTRADDREQLNLLGALKEVLVLSTCNRIEIYGAIAEEADGEAVLMAYMAAQHSVDTAWFRDYLYFYEGEAAIDHLARVAAGLDSLVLGEPQILGQVIDAYMQGVERHSAGLVLDALFRAAIRVGKRARNETAISSNPVSISSVAITMAQQNVGDLGRQRVLIVGVGEMGQLALNALRKRGGTQIALANRSRERAEKLAAEWGGPVYELDELPAALAAADVVICATSSPHSIITAPMVVKAQADGRRIVLIDIAVPRDVEPAVAALPGVSLYNVDDLQEGLDAALKARRQEVPQVEAIIVEEMAALDVELRKLAVHPLISALRQQAEEIRQRELQRTLRFLGDDVDPETLRHVQHLSRSLVNKLLHEPTLCLREKATNGQAADYAETVRELFALDPTEG